MDGISSGRTVSALRLAPTASIPGGRSDQATMTRGKLQPRGSANDIPRRIELGTDLRATTPGQIVLVATRTQVNQNNG